MSKMKNFPCSPAVAFRSLAPAQCAHFISQRLSSGRALQGDGLTVAFMQMCTCTLCCFAYMRIQLLYKASARKLMYTLVIKGAVACMCVCVYVVICYFQLCTHFPPLSLLTFPHLHQQFLLLNPHFEWQHSFCVSISVWRPYL